ncbi:MAG: immunogenic protein precursor, partial [Candidatus Rokuibacteriota bacterium]
AARRPSRRAVNAATMALTLTLATATPGGGFPVYGDAVIAAVREVDPALTIEPRNTKGSTENVPLLEKNEVDLALVQG